MEMNNRNKSCKALYCGNILACPSILTGVYLLTGYREERPASREIYRYQISGRLEAGIELRERFP